MQKSRLLSRRDNLLSMSVGSNFQLILLCGQIRMEQISKQDPQRQQGRKNRIGPKDTAQQRRCQDTHYKASSIMPWANAFSPASGCF